MREITELSVIRAVKEQVSCNLAGESVILNLKSGQYYGLDPVGARIWSLIQEPRRIREVRDIMLQEYDVDADICERDLMDLLKDLQANELIDVMDGT